MPAQRAVQALQQTPGNKQHLGKSDMTLTDATAGERTKVAEYRAELPFLVRDDIGGRLVFAAAEEFTTNGTADDTETFSLSNNIVDTSNTNNLVLFEEGSRVQADSIDYSADSFDYTDDGTSNTLHVFYVARDPGSVTVEKVAPKTASQVSEILTEDTTSGLADRDQNQNPVEFEFTDPLQGVVPTDWKLEIYVDAPAAVRWDDSGLSNPNDPNDEATNAVVDLPIVQLEQDVPGLDDAVKRSALGLEG